MEGLQHLDMVYMAVKAGRESMAEYLLVVARKHNVPYYEIVEQHVYMQQSTSTTWTFLENWLSRSLIASMRSPPVEDILDSNGGEKLCGCDFGSRGDCFRVFLA
jgi:hypothetical protein